MCVCVSVCMYVCVRVESEQSFHLATKLDPLFYGPLHQITINHDPNECTKMCVHSC